MSDCLLTLGRKEPCKDSVGGVKNLYFINFGEVDFFIDADTEQITDIKSKDGSPAVLYKWEVKMGTNLEETIVSSRETGTTAFQQVLNATFKKLDPVTRKQLKLMAFGRPHMIIEDYNGNALLVGEENGMDSTGGTIVTGNAMTDLSGYTLVMQGDESEPSYHLAGSTKNNPFGGLTTPPIVITGEDEAEFTLGGAACGSGSVTGTFANGVALDGTQYIEFTVSVTKEGVWSLDSDSVNGYRFSGQGTFTATGTQTVRLYGSGTPQSAQIDTFTITSNFIGGAGLCTQDVTVT